MRERNDSLLMPNIDANQMQNQKLGWICEYANIIFGAGAWAASCYLRTADPETFFEKLHRLQCFSESQIKQWEWGRDRVGGGTWKYWLLCIR